VDPTGSWREIARHDVVMATIQDYAERAGAARVSVLLDRGDGHQAPLLEAEAGQPLTVSQGEEDFVIPPGALSGVEPLPLHPSKPLPATAIAADATLGEVAAPIGALEAMAASVEELARVLGGRTVAVAEFATRSGDALTIAARAGEPTVLAIGEHTFALPGRDLPNG
jgi:hypothetical protein